MQEGNPGLDRRKVGDRTEIHYFLNTSRGQKGKPRLPNGHNVGMIAEYRESVTGDGAGTDVKNSR
jgi:hypothetical protein